MKVAINWLEEMVNLKAPIDKVVSLLPLRTIGTKEVTDKFIELDMKGYNRADLLSMRGVGYEVAAITGSQVNFEEEDSSKFVWVDRSIPEIGVEIENEADAPVYCVAKIEGLKVEQSDETWVKKLSDSGMRSINNIADVTNLVMLEYGQPLHAFDGFEVKNEAILVRRARDKENLITLDNKSRELSSEDIVIADPDKALGIAGVMGGKNSEVGEKTTTILLEAAIFDPVVLRKTSNRLGLSSEASKRFYHGLARKRLLQALDSAVRMYESLGGKLVGLTLKGDLEDQQKKIPLRLSKVNELVGVDFTAEQVEDYLKRLNFEISSRIAESPSNKSSQSWVITPPYYRLDIEIEEDLVEEVARMYGYENIKAKQLIGEVPGKINQSLFELIQKLKTALVNLGLTEVQTYSFYSTQILEVLGFRDEYKKILVKVANPISSETEYMRQSIWANLLEVVAKNAKQGFSDIAIFEIGKVYSQSEEGPSEKYSLTIALMNGTDHPITELNQIFARLLMEFRDIKGVKVEQSELPEVVSRIFHPVRFCKISRGSMQIGGMSEIHPRISDKLGIPKRVAILEFDLSGLLK